MSLLGERTMSVELHQARRARVGDVEVARCLPALGRRTVGAFCFCDVMGPSATEQVRGVAPHPHMGLMTATWLFDGSLVHHDSLDNHQRLVPGELNVMVAGNGISHSEEPDPDATGSLRGAQLWIAQPDSTRHGAADFAHHHDLERVSTEQLDATVLFGTLAGASSPARCDTALVAAELRMRGTTSLELDAGFEHAIVAIDASLEVDGVVLEPSDLAFLAPGAKRVDLSGTGVALLLGGEPFGEELVMWWNYVARDREEVLAAHASWLDDDGRFGTVASELARETPPGPTWRL